MADIVALDRPRDAFAEQAPPATRVRGYWQSVFYRLRHDPVTLVFAAIVLLDRAGGDLRAADRAVRPVQGEHRRPAEAVRLARPSCSAPTNWAATCCPGCSMAAGSRC